MITRVLVANRGEIAVRVMRTCQRMGIATVAIHSAVEAGALHVEMADEAVEIAASSPAGSYLDGAAIIEAARRTRAGAIHPGYGFLAENADFARAVVQAGLTWIGPDADAIDQVGDKVRARNLMQDAGVPVAAGSREITTTGEEALAAATAIGFPVMVKASAGGGGIGMGVANDEDELLSAFERVSTQGARFFDSPHVLIERFVARARHVEVQILGLRDGRILVLGERECSVQRRNQKLAEESPSPALTEQLREDLFAAARKAGEAVSYLGAGTVEFLLDADEQSFMFLELNARLQVEHPITEWLTGIDLVEQQIRIAAADPAAITETPPSQGHAVELRICAEDPHGFRPGPGSIDVWRAPDGEGIRVDAGYRQGDVVSSHFDSLLAKLSVCAPTRSEALARAREALARFEISGPSVNLPFFTELLDRHEFVNGDYDTGIVGRMRSTDRVH